MKVLGLDGCRGGWVGVLTDPAFAAPRAVGGNDLDALLVESGPEIVVIDIPIGLSANEHARCCDIAARRAMKGKGSSVFNTPVRGILAATDYATALEINRSMSGKGFSRQAWAIVPKIKEADLVARSRPTRLREGHPELSFTIANGGNPVLASKSTAAGLFQRLQLLAKVGFPIDRLDLSDLPARALADDLADAAIMAWTAGRLAKGKAALFPPTLTCDEYGLPMQMVA